MGHHLLFNSTNAQEFYAQQRYGTRACKILFIVRYPRRGDGHLKTPTFRCCGLGWTQSQRIGQARTIAMKTSTGFLPIRLLYELLTTARIIMGILVQGPGDTRSDWIVPVR